MPILTVEVSDDNGQIYLCNVLHDRHLLQCMGIVAKGGMEVYTLRYLR